MDQIICEPCGCNFGFAYIVSMKKGLLLFCICMVAVFAFAHEFWLSPQKFFYSVRETAHIRFQVGENFTGENWTGNRDKIQHLSHYTPSNEIIDLSPRLSEHKGDSLSLPLPEIGTHMVTFNSTNSFIQLEADKFNAYLMEDGMTEVLQYRKEHHELQDKGKEYYQRSVKTLLQVGDRLTDACTNPTGLPLDIIPEQNPYNLPADLTSEREGLLKMRFQVLFFGKPLENALVKIWYHPPGKPVQADDRRTNKKGWVTAERHPGPIMVSCVHMERSMTDTVANWQSYWGSLSFEYSHFFPGSAMK